jgi:large subunit ribosomal protein L21
MYAVIQTGGKQYKVAKDEVLVVEKLEAEPGAKLTFESVLMVGDGTESTVGAPYVAGATVAAEVVEQSRAPKIIVFKKKRRKNYRRRKGHRQHQTVLRITDILTEGAERPQVDAMPEAKTEPCAPEAAESAPPEVQTAVEPAAEKSEE